MINIAYENTLSKMWPQELERELGSVQRLRSISSEYRQEVRTKTAMILEKMKQ